MSDSVGIVVPAYQPDIARLRNYVTNIETNLSPATILVELDSPDQRTEHRLSDLPARIETVPYRRGKGSAITDGFEELETDILAFADADGATPTPSLTAVIEKVRTDSTDLSVGSRRHPGSTVDDHQTVIRRFLGNGFSWLASRMLSVSLYDYQCGAKAITAESWTDIREHLYEPGFAWDVELIAIAGALDLAIKEVPIEWEDRPGSTVAPVEDSVDLFRALVSARHRARQLRDDQLHKAIAAHSKTPTPLVELKK